MLGKLGQDDRHSVVWHPAYADFARDYGFQPWAHWPYHPQTKGKVESGVNYVKRNALAGKRFAAWDQLNAWLLEWRPRWPINGSRGRRTRRPTRASCGRSSRRSRRSIRAPCMARERVSHRVVATDALVAIGGSRYSVPVQFVGATVTLRELLGAYEILHAGHVIARHAHRGRHQVVMERAHYAGLLEPARTYRLRAADEPPRHDPRYP